MEEIIKGNSIIAFLDDYTVVDLETTGFSAEHDDIIELGAVKVHNNKIVGTYQKLIRPSVFLSPFVSGLTGITDEMLKYSPDLDSVIDEFVDFIGDDVVVGHNVGFDINFICNKYQKLRDKKFTNDFVNTIRFSKKINREQRHHNLGTLCELYNIGEDNMHRAESDCVATQQLYEILKQQAICDFGSEEAFISSFKKKGKKNSNSSNDYKKIFESLVPENGDIDETNSFYDKVCVFTGTLEKMKRTDAAQIVVNLGGTVATSVTKNTNYLVLGNNDYCSSIKDGKSNKQKKAEQLILNGSDLIILDENTFYNMIIE